MDGWTAWRLDRDGSPTLDSLRQQLLNQKAVTVTTDDGETAEQAFQADTRHEWLTDARSRADEGNATEIPVRQLLELWNAKARGYLVNQQIEADLANHGLTTSPSFRKVTLDTPVTVISVVTADEKAVDAEVAEAEEVAGLDPGLTVGNIPAALGGIVSVSPNATFDEVVTLMEIHDYSQLAVLTSDRGAVRAVTWKSIARCRHVHSSAGFVEAIVEAHETPYDKPLIDVLPTLQAHDFIFVRNEKNLVAGIITTADVVHAYGDLATPFFLIGELDQALNKIISRTFTLKQVLALCDPGGRRRIKGFDDLTMGDYQRTLENPESWTILGWPLDRKIFIERLDELRRMRNDVMHFDPDPLSSDTVDKLRIFLDLLRRYFS
jgi:CBS domain-containing protein